MKLILISSGNFFYLHYLLFKTIFYFRILLNPKRKKEKKKDNVILISTCIPQPLPYYVITQKGDRKCKVGRNKGEREVVVPTFQRAVIVRLGYIMCTSCFTILR